MPDNSTHGPRISGAEFDARIAELYAALPATPSSEEQRRASRREFDLVIDHRLGTEFPEDRREALWAVQERLQRHPVRMATAWALRKVMPRFLARATQSLSASVIGSYRSVLSESELAQFFGRDELAQPNLPLGTEAQRRGTSAD